MKPIISLVCVFLAGLSLFPASAAQPKLASQFDFSSDTTPGARKFYFETIPGHRYTLWRSTDLQNWTPVAGYPQTATGLSMEHTFAQATKEFFQIEPIDDHAPVIEEQFPGVDSYAVRRFDDLRFLLSDATGIDPASIRLSVGGGAALPVGAAGLTYVDGILTYDSGDTALGGYGTTVPVTLTVADTLGHSTTHTFSFTLEVQPKVVSNLYVFGSPAAQRAGQQLPATPTAELARLTGPVRMDGADPWTVETVLPDRVILAYTGPAAPVFTAGMYLTNKVPVKASDVFYRKIFSVSDDVANKKLTLVTVDVPFAEIVEEGTCSLSGDSMVYDLGADGTIQRAAQFSKSKTLPRVGIDMNGTGPFTFPGNQKFSVSLPEASIWLTPTLEMAVETKDFSVQRVSIQARGDIEAALVPELRFLPLGSEKEKELDLHTPVTKLVLVGMVGYVPVWMDYTYSTKLKIEAEADVAVALTAGWRRNMSITSGAEYVKGASPAVRWVDNVTASRTEEVPLTLSLGGTLRDKVSIVPQLDVRLLSLLGFYVNVAPTHEAEISASGALSFFPEEGRLQMTPGGSATLTHKVYVDLNVGLSVAGVDQSGLPAFAPVRFLERGWGPRTWPEPAMLAFLSPTAPQAVAVEIGGTLRLEGQAQGGDSAVFYQWFRNGSIILGATDRVLTKGWFGAAEAGTYTLRAKSSEETVWSPAFTVSAYNAGTPLDGFALIPAGSFQMGDALDGSSNAPVHSVYVSAFYMGKCEVTKEEWDAVRAWGLTNGYTDLAAGNGSYTSKGENHPVHSITWYDMVKWCNARSEKENLTPCYTVSGVIYRTDNSTPDCNWNASGYRLPTEAEWEKAARGSQSGKRFPWGDTISQSQANYSVYSSNGTTNYYSYDVTPRPPAAGDYFYHPSYTAGGSPYTSPVGSFVGNANGYGLFDMSGNVWERCWDWNGSSYYTTSPGSDPRGPDSGTYRVGRGGSWGCIADDCRVADRHGDNPMFSDGNIGFRIARSLVP